MKKTVLPILISVFMMLSNMLCANASENILREVDVKRGANSYTIELTSGRPAEITKNIISTNRIILNLKNITTNNHTKTNYENGSAIDNIIIEPNGTTGTNIMIQGDNIIYSNVKFKEPSFIEIAGDNILSSFNSLLGIFKGNNSSNRKIQFGILSLLFGVIVMELRFIKSKYDELQQEKKEMLKNIEETKDFKDYLPGYGKSGIKKPYTTPIYKTNISVNTNIPKQTTSFRRMPGTMTLSSILKNPNKEEVIIDRIVNNTPSFGSLLGTSSAIKERAKTASNPIEKSRLNSNIRHLEAMTAYYKNRATLENAQETIQTRLNTVY